MGISGSSAGKEPTCNAGDSSSIPGSGRSIGEGIGYPLQYSWASMVAQLVRKTPAVWETWVRSLGWEDPLEKGTATHSSILAWRIPCMVHGSHSQTQLNYCHFHHDKWLNLSRFSIIITSMALTIEMHNIPCLDVKIFNQK